MINRTQFYKFLENLDWKYCKEHLGKENVFKDEFDAALEKTLEILKENDEQYKKEQESLPTLQVFYQEQTKAKRGYYTFEIKLKNGKSYTFKDNEIYTFFKDSALMTNYVVINSEVITTQEGWYQSESQWSYPELLCKVVVDEKENYENIRAEVN